MNCCIHHLEEFLLNLYQSGVNTYLLVGGDLMHVLESGILWLTMNQICLRTQLVNTIWENQKIRAQTNLEKLRLTFVQPSIVCHWTVNTVVTYKDSSLLYHSRETVSLTALLFLLTSSPKLICILKSVARLNRAICPYILSIRGKQKKSEK